MTTYAQVHAEATTQATAAVDKFFNDVLKGEDPFHVVLHGLLFIPKTRVTLN